MRRQLLAALLAASAPLLAAGQTLPTLGQILFSPDAVISAEECSSSATTVGLTWWIQPDSGFTVTSGVFRVYASNQDRSGTPYCFTEADNGSGTIKAKRLISTDITATSDLETVAHPVATSDIASVATTGCATGTFTAYVCVQWLVGDVVRGYAKGTVSVKLDGPAKPVIGSVEIGDTRLNVRVKASTATPVATHFRAKAVADTDPTDLHLSPLTAVTDEATIGGLTNGVPYRVTAFAYTAEGNPSAESTWVAGDPLYTPRPIIDAWERYQALGGVDSGGCQAGAAGLLALLGGAALLRLRRRS